MGFLGLRMPRFGFRMTKGEWFESMVRKSFEAVDVDKDGELDKKEIFIGLLKLYDNLNAKLPCHVTVPDMAEIDALMARHDVDASGKLAYAEYLDLCKTLVGTRKDWRHSIALKVTVAVVLKMVAFPLGGQLIKRGIHHFVPAIPKSLVPTAVTVFAVEAAYKAAGGVV